MTSALAGAVAAAARALPLEQVVRLADAVAGCQDAAHAARRDVAATVATPAFHGACRRLLDAWSAASVPGAAVALALRAAADVARAERLDERVDVVCTGPSTPSSAVRLTGVVVADVIDEARASLLVVSFAAYRVPAVMAALGRAADAGVGVDLILETAADSRGRLSHDAADEFGALGPNVRLWHWPLERRPVLERGHAVLHAKAIVADRRVALVTSANLTQLAAERNIELGLLIRGGPVPGRIADYFAGLIDAQVLARAPDSPRGGRE